MSRLIRDTDLIEWIDMCEKKLFPALSKDGTVKSNLTVVLEAIASTPTAYSVETVVRELEAKSTFYAHEAEKDKDIGHAYLATRKYGISDGLDIAIEIVRGGRNE